MTATYDVVIAGGGLAGTALAALLSQHGDCAGLRVALIEPKPFSPGEHKEGFDPRVIALTEASRGLLAKLGTWPALAGPRACPYHRMVVRDSEGTGVVAFDCADVGRPDLGHIVENGRVLAGLLDTLAQSRVTVLSPAAIADIGVDDDGVVVTLADGGQLETALLVGADGARSLVRQRCDFRVRQWDYGHSAIVATICTSEDHGYTARQWFMASGPLAFLPLRTDEGDCHYSSIVWSQQREEADRLMALPDHAFCHELSRASERALGEVVSVSRRFAFPLRQHHAVDYVQPGIALVGDAAHSIHPLAGQGANLGFADVAVLAEEIARGARRGLSPGDLSVLQRYQRRRKPENLAMMAAMETFKRLFEQEAPWLRLLRNQGMNSFNRLSPVKNRVIRRAMGL